jgi:lipase chaperone LimK
VRRRRVLAGVAAAGAVAGWLVLRSAERAPAPASIVGTPAPASTLDSPPVDVLPPPARVVDAYAGTQVDGHLAVDAEGRFVPTSDALRLFDYFFLARGELSDAEIVALIEREILDRLPAGARPDALALLDGYLEYRDRARALHESGAVPADLERRLQWIRELRRAVFGESVAAAVFAESEALDLAAVERNRIRADPSLDPDEKRARLAEVDAGLPEAERRSRERLAAPLRLAAEVEVLRESGADPASIFAAREERFGYDAALRLEALDRDRDAWQARLTAYRAERDALRAEGADAETLAALRARHFSSGEVARVRALDAMATSRLRR